MEYQFTARHFKARPELKDFAKSSVEQLTNIYDGIVNAEVVLAVEPHDRGKIAEIGLMVYQDKLFAKETSDEFNKSISACVEKLEKQLRRYKEKLHRGQRPQEKPVAPPNEEEL